MTKYRKSWTDALKEIRSNVPDKIEKDETDVDYHYGHEPQGLDDQYIEHLEESAGLQLKMAFDDAKIKIKGTKGGKLVIDKKDEKKVEKIIAKQMKDKSAAKRVLGSQIVFEETEIDEKTYYNLERGVYEMGKEKHDRKKEVKQGYPNAIEVKSTVKQAAATVAKLNKEEVELDEKAAAYPATVDTLKMIVKDKQHKTVMFDKGSAKVDLFTASAMLTVYKALKQPHLKKKFEDMIKSKEGFMQTQAFAMKVTK